MEEVAIVYSLVDWIVVVSEIVLALELSLDSDDVLSVCWCGGFPTSMLRVEFRCRVVRLGGQCLCRAVVVFVVFGVRVVSGFGLSLVLCRRRGV